MPRPFLTQWLIIAAACLMLAPPAQGRALAQRGTTVGGRVIAIQDGDTITILVNRSQVRIRLHGIDCPERGQPYSRQAKEFTADAVFGKTVTARVMDIDRYGRVVAEVFLPDGRSLNREIVRAGFAWWYRKYAPNDRQLERLEAEAKQARRGQWADAIPSPPWLWRQLR